MIFQSQIQGRQRPKFMYTALVSFTRTILLKRVVVVVKTQIITEGSNKNYQLKMNSYRVVGTSTQNAPVPMLKVTKIDSTQLQLPYLLPTWQNVRPDLPELSHPTFPTVSIRFLSLVKKQQWSKVPIFKDVTLQVRFRNNWLILILRKHWVLTCILQNQQEVLGTTQVF